MKTQKELKAKIKLAAERMADRERQEWPPGCYGFIYQPMRPSNKETNVSKTET